MYGNVTAPPTDDTRANEANKTAVSANEHAINAVTEAGIAKEAADSAQASAATAKAVTDEIEGYAQTVSKTVAQVLEDGETAGIAAQQAREAATSALKGLASVEDVVDTLNWIATHCEYEKTTDVTIVTGKAYHTVTATQVASPTDDDIVTYYELVSGAYVKTTDTSVVSGKTYYTLVGEPVTNPVVADIGTYYELEITEAVSNYINTHVAVTDEGLWLIPDDTQGSNKVLIAVGGTGHTYEQAGTYILDGSDNVLAQFLASGAQIGQTGESHLEMDYHSLQMIDGDANPHVFFHVSDLRDENNEYAYTDTFVGNGTIKRFTLAFSPKNRNVTVTVSDGSGGAASISDIVSTWLTFETAPSSGATITVSYVTSSYLAKAYTLGMRKANSVIGPLSTCFGLNCTASESRSFAEGWSSEANGPGSHAEGYETKANGSYSHAQGDETVANRAYQVAIGRFNEIDNYGYNAGARGKYVFIIGNGTDDDARSNALTADWDGNVEASGGITTGGDVDVTGDVTASGSFKDGTNNRLLNYGDIVAVEVRIKHGLTANNGTQTSGTATVSKAGWYPIGIVGHRCDNGSGSGGSYALPHAIRISSASVGSATVSYGIRAVGGNVSNCDLYATILWKRQ